MFRHPVAAIFGGSLAFLPFTASAEIVKFQADGWTTECDTAHETPEEDCYIIGVFRGTSAEGIKASFSLLADLKNHQVAIVGDPAPTATTLRIEKNPAMQCAGTPHCIFSSSDAETITQQLRAGSLILIDVFAANRVLRFSLSTKGYRAGLAKINAHGYRLP